MDASGRSAPAGLVVAPIEIVAEAAVLRPCGEIDASTAPVLRRAVEAGAATGLPLLVIDLSGVTFLESAGLAVLIGAHRDMPPGQRVALAAVPPRMRRMLEVAAVDQIMSVHNGGDPWPWPNVAPPK
jgi:anti-sigma B factor antagonist